MGIVEAVHRRRKEREELLAWARSYADGLPDDLAVVGAAVVGSVARGDFNLWSDVDVLVVAIEVPDRLEAAAPWPAWLQPVVWKPDEWHHRLSRDDPMAAEAVHAGVWVRGGPPASG